MSYGNSHSRAEAAPRRSLRSILISVVAFLFAGAMMLIGGRSMSAAPAPAQEPAKSLIYCGWYGGTLPTPSYIAANKDFLETQPFNGLAVYMRNSAGTVNATTAIMRTTPISYDTIMSVLAPIDGANFSQLRDNFAVVMGSAPPDFFDNWSTTVQNFANLAAACRDAGLHGIIFDNEQYFSPWGDFPTGVKYSGNGLAAYQQQAALRGKECMQAMTAQYPDIAVITLHGPYISEPDAPPSLFPQWQSGNELLGPFFAGFQEGTTQPGQNVDGGELYDLRSSQEFQDSYTWRRHTFPSSQVDSQFLNPTVRSSYASSVSISFGVYDRPFAGAAMNSTVVTDTVSKALRQADRWVWYYSESYSYLKPPSQGGAPTTWVEAVRAALPAGMESTSPLLSDGGGSSGGGGGGRCGLLGMEVAPLFLALTLLRRRKQAKAS